MFCYQCEQTTAGVGCTDIGACGKDADVSDLQDLLIDAAERLARSLSARPADERPEGASALLEDALFTTVTNVNFDADRVEELIVAVDTMTDPDNPEASGATRDGRLDNAFKVGIAARRARFGETVAGLQDLLLFGLKGMAAYAHHARRLGRTDPTVDAFMIEALTKLGEGLDDADQLTALNLACGEATVAVLALLDGANTGSYGHPVPTPVRMGHVPGKAILVSGHDLKDLKALLEQTEGTGINVYTHGEMLPAHGYPELKKHAHFVGHYGGAWMRQRSEFDSFPGPILMTTNCIQRPAPSYANRIFTCGLVAFPSVQHIAGDDFSALIEAAKAAPGFTDETNAGDHLVGFGHNTVLSVADTVIDAVKSGDLKKFVLIGGCDGMKFDRSYYTDLATSLPKDWAILTLGCGKYRVIGHDYGKIGDLPRLLDMGQCNDAFSAVKVAQALADAFECGINDLPLHLVLSWYEQKAVCILLALLHLGVKNIRIGPSLPAFISPAVLKVLVETFNIMPIDTVENDLKAMQAA
ncbi:hydroxylamine reductase [Breoghania sp. JC706]|uniref:hydroxylamine reductase n=1 Tax=Breoghania sp. JC706 TaxID=3117732 RepID=UPI003008A573